MNVNDEILFIGMAVAKPESITGLCDLSNPLLSGANGESGKFDLCTGFLPIEGNRILWRRQRRR
jgi:hypothetical protein